MGRGWCLVSILVGGCSLYFGDPTQPPGDPPPVATQPAGVQPVSGDVPPAYATLAVGPVDVMDVALDDDYVYWVANHQLANESDVFRVAKTGGPTEHIVHVDGRVYSFAVDDTYVYVPVYDQSDAGAPFLRVPKTGGTPEVIEDHLRYLAFAAVHDGDVYLAALVDEPTVDYQLWRYPLGSGPHQVLVDGLRGPESLAFDSVNLYVTTAGDSGFHEAPLEGGASSAPIPALYALHVLSDGDHVYFMSGAIEECTSAHVTAWQRGSTTRSDLGPVPGCVNALALTSHDVLSIDTYSHTLTEYPLDGSGPQVLVGGLPSPMGLAAEPDGSSIYWGDFYTGAIYRLDR